MKTTLKIIDQVNCKFYDLDAFTRRKLVDALKYFLPHSRHTPAFKLGRWDGTTSFFQVSGATYVGLLDKVLPIILDAGYEVEIEDERVPQEFEFPECDEFLLADTLWPKGHPAEGEPVMLRDYQVKAINDFFQNPQSMQQIATGAGKSIITGALSKLCEKFGRTLTIVPSKSLVVQTEVDYKNIGLDVGVYFGDRKEVGHTHTISTWQSLSAMMRNRSDDQEVTIEDMIEGVVTVVVDECFDGDELVLTPNGYVKIKDMKPGDTVINYSEANGKFKEDIVVKVHKNLVNSASERMYELTFDNGASVKVTGNHKFLTQRGWVRADELTEDDDIVSYGGEHAKKDD